MKRKVLIVLFSIGTIGGFASGFAGLARHHCSRRASFEQHVARACADAARAHSSDAPPDR